MKMKKVIRCFTVGVLLSQVAVVPSFAAAERIGPSSPETYSSQPTRQPVIRYIPSNKMDKLDIGSFNNDF